MAACAHGEEGICHTYAVPYLEGMGKPCASVACNGAAAVHVGYASLGKCAPSCEFLGSLLGPGQSLIKQRLQDCLARFHSQDSCPAIHISAVRLASACTICPIREVRAFTEIACVTGA